MSHKQGFEAMFRLLSIRRCLPLAAAVAIFILGVTPTFAAEPLVPEMSMAFDEQTKADIQAVISGQLAAFIKGDFEAAEDYAAPVIKERFGTPALFFEMVKSQYSALLHARSTQFIEVSGSSRAVLQTMTLTDVDGMVWAVSYSLEKIEDKWRINGCSIEKNTSQLGI